MADSKYGRIFTDSDLEKIFEWLWEKHGLTTDLKPENVLSAMDEAGVRFKFPASEPTMTFRARDKRAVGAIRFYEDHQSPRAPMRHLYGIEESRRAFEKYREDNPHEMKEPD